MGLSCGRGVGFTVYERYLWACELNKEEYNIVVAGFILSSTEF